MQIQIKDNSRNGSVLVRTNYAQRRAERQLDEILARIREAKEEMRKAIYE